MNPVLGLMGNMAGLFFDDGRLAIAVLMILGATAIIAHSGLFAEPVRIVFLVSAVMAALLENVVRSAGATMAAVGAALRQAQDRPSSPRSAMPHGSERTAHTRRG